MVIITSVSFPTESSKELGKRFLEAPAFPDFITRKGPYFSSNKKDGIIVFSIYEVDRSRVADAIEFATNFLATFIGVPGFKYEIKTYLETAEALKMIGMAQEAQRSFADSGKITEILSVFWEQCHAPSSAIHPLKVFAFESGGIFVINSFKPYRQTTRYRNPANGDWRFELATKDASNGMILIGQMKSARNFQQVKQNTKAGLMATAYTYYKVK